MTESNIYQFKVFKMQKNQIISNKYSHIGKSMGCIFLTNSIKEVGFIRVIDLLEYVDRLPEGKAIPLNLAKTLSKRTFMLDDQMYNLIMFLLAQLEVVRYDMDASIKTIEKLPESNALPYYLKFLLGPRRTMNLVWLFSSPSSSSYPLYLK